MYTIYCKGRGKCEFVKKCSKLSEAVNNVFVLNGKSKNKTYYFELTGDGKC